MEDYNDVFADIINGLLFGGEQEIKPEDLENTTVHAQYKAEDDKVHELERDIAKYWKDEKVELAICGIENQSIVEKNMPFRIIGYDGSAYRNQLQQERRKNATGGDNCIVFRDRQALEQQKKDQRTDGNT